MCIHIAVFQQQEIFSLLPSFPKSKNISANIKTQVTIFVHSLNHASLFMHICLAHYLFLRDTTGVHF